MGVLGRRLLMALVLVVPGAALWLHGRGFREVDPTGLPDGAFLAAAGVWDGRLWQYELRLGGLPGRPR